MFVQKKIKVLIGLIRLKKSVVLTKVGRPITTLLVHSCSIPLKNCNTCKDLEQQLN